MQDPSPKLEPASQLRLFERMRCRVDPSDKAYKCYRLECIQNQILRTKILPAEIRVFRDQGGRHSD